jgi:hypothetical protein
MAKAKKEKKVISGDAGVYELLKDAEPIVTQENPAHAFKNQLEASNESLLSRLRAGTPSKDVLEICARFESALRMLAKPQRFYRKQFETASGYKHGSKDEREYFEKIKGTGGVKRNASEPVEEANGESSLSDADLAKIAEVVKQMLPAIKGTKLPK